MWATFALLPDALDLRRTSGFPFKTGGPWIKPAGNPAMGNGSVLRSTAELFLIGALERPGLGTRSKETC
jgi:hypothetical protein